LQQFKPDSDDSTGKLPNEVPVFRYIHQLSKSYRKGLKTFQEKMMKIILKFGLVDVLEATTDFKWTDTNRTKWFSWFLTGSAKITWQRTVTDNRGKR